MEDDLARPDPIQTHDDFCCLSMSESKSLSLGLRPEVINRRLRTMTSESPLRQPQAALL